MGYIPSELNDATDDLRVRERAKGMVDAFKEQYLPTPEPPPVELPQIDFGSALKPFRDTIEQAAQATQSTVGGFGEAISGALAPYKQQIMGGVPSNGVQPVMRGAVPQGGGYAGVTPDEPVTRDTVTRAAAAALNKAGLPAEMAPYIAGIAINEGILQPGTIARDHWSVGGVKAPGSAGVVTVPTREVINGQSVMQTASFGKFNSMQEGMDSLATFVRDSPRFGPIAKQAAATGDYSGMIEGFRQQGYATDPNWTKQVNSIAGSLPAPTSQATAMPAPGQSTSAAFAGGSLTPDQFNSGLSTADAYAACGPAAAVAFARRFGRNPTLQEATDLAKQYGWSPEQGMGRGTAGTVDTANALGAVVKAGPVDDARISADVQRGNPVGINLGGGPGNNGHFMVAERYDPSTGKFDFGNSAKALKASGGNTWFSLAELPKLGFGSPRDAIYADAPDSPSPSVVAGSSQKIKGMDANAALSRYGNQAMFSDPEADPAPPDTVYPHILDDSTGADPTLAPSFDQPAGDVRGSGHPWDRYPTDRVREDLLEQERNPNILSKYGGLAMEDLSGVSGSGSREEDGAQGYDNRDGVSLGSGSGTMVPPVRDIRGDYTPRAVEPGDYQIEAVPAAQQDAMRPVLPVSGSGTVAAGGAQPLETAPIPSTRPVDAVEPGASQAPASAGNPLTQLADWFQGGADLLRKALQPANDAAVGALNAGADAIGTTFQRGRENPSPSQQLGNMVMDQAGDLVQSNVENWSNVAAKATGDRIGHRMTPQEQQAATERSLRIIESNPFAPGVYTAVPEVIGMASTSREALDRLAAQKRAGNLAPSPAMGIISRAQADDAAKPITAYHYTQGEPFQAFDPAKIGSQTDDGLLGRGFYVSTDPNIGKIGDSETVARTTTLQADVHLQNPLVVEFPKFGTNKTQLVNEAIGTKGLAGQELTDELVRRGHDGVVLDYAPTGYQHKEMVVFDPSQAVIKQAERNGEITRFPAPTAGIVSRAQADEAAPAVDRYYHGTGSDFARPDGGGFLPASRASDNAPAEMRKQWAEGQKSLVNSLRRNIEAFDGDPKYEKQVAKWKEDLAEAEDTLQMLNRGIQTSAERDAFARTPTGMSGNPVVQAGVRAVGAGVGAGYQESQREGSTPESVLAHGIGGAVTSGGNSLAGKLIGRKGVTLLSRAVESGAENERKAPPIGPRGGEIPRQERAAQLSRPIKLTTDEEIARIRVDKFPEEIRDDLVQAAKSVDFGQRLRRGVLSDDAVQQLAQEYAPSVEGAISASHRGKAYNAEEIIGLRNLVVGQHARVKDLTEQLADEGFNVGTAAQLAAEQAKFKAIAEIAFGGAPAEAGRALRQFRQLAQNIEVDPANAGLRYLKQQYGTLDNAEEAMSKYLTMVKDGADPVALVSFLRNARGSWLNRLGIVRYSSMLSSATTHAINATGNALMNTVDVATKPLAVGIDVARSRVTGKPREVFASEIGAQLHGMGGGIKQGVQDAGFIMTHGFRPDDITKLDHLREGFGTNIPMVAPAGSRRAGAVDFIMEGPLRTLSAADAIFRGISHGGHLAAEATSAALKAGRGESGKVSAEVLQEFMGKPEVMERAEALSRRTVLQEDRALTNWILQSRNLPGPQRAAIEAVIPFVRTPFNLMAQGLEMTPLGVAKMIADARTGKTAREQADTAARMAIGTAVMGAAAWQSMSGNLTGPRPEKEAERSTLPPGWQPWSFRHEDQDGNVKYYPLAAMGPLAVPAVTSILITEAAKGGKPIDLPAAAMGVGQFFVDQTFFRGISDAMKALTEGGSKIENYIESVSTQYSPHFLGGGALGRQIQQITGQPLRDPHGALEALLATHPLTAEQVPVRRDVLGRPQVNAPGGLETALSPIRSSVERDDPVIAAFRRAGEGLPTYAPKKLRDPDTGETVELSRTQQDRWRVAFGRAVRDNWDVYGRPTDVKQLRKVEQESRDDAMMAVLGG